MAPNTVARRQEDLEEQEKDHRIPEDTNCQEEDTGVAKA